MRRSEPDAITRAARPPSAQGSLGGFALVMATAIASIATEGAGAGASTLLLWLAAGAFAGLATGTVMRMIVGRAEVMARLRRPRTAFDSLTIVAAAGVLSARFGLDGRPAAASALAAVTALSWLVLVVLVAMTLIANRRHLRPELSGNWLLVVVATQSLAGVTAMTARSWDDPALSVVGLAAWMAGVTLYAVLLLPISRRLRRLAARRRFTPDYWIAMGALAISTLAAAALLQAPGTPLRPLLRSGGLVAWAGACLWIPVLAVADARMIVGDRAGLPSAARWSMVFPLGMFAASAQAYGRADAAPTLTLIGGWAAWVAVAAWAIVAIGTARSAITVAAACFQNQRYGGGR
jgi:tellurite resistance protein TehA-like permease